MKLDLNLLRVFDILMEVRSVSRTADQLGVTQSAVSHALARLRDHLDDPLFVRARGGLLPTPRAHEIAPRVREGLAALRDAVSQPVFDPASTTRAFTIGASSYFCVTLLPLVIQTARAAAPLAHFKIVMPGEDVAGALDQGAMDVAFGGFGRVPTRFGRARLYIERFVWIGRAGTDPATLPQRPRITLTRVPQPGLQREFLTRGGLEQRVTMIPDDTLVTGPSPLTIHDPLSAGALIASSDLVTLMPLHLARLMTGTGVEILGAGDFTPFEMSMLWHNRTTTDPALAWLRGVIVAASATLDARDAADPCPGTA